MLNERHIVLAALSTGEHVQVGRAQSHDEAHTLFERLDSQVSGFYRDNGRLRFDNARRREHFIDGTSVSFYRVRQVPNEFGSVRRFPVSAVRLTNRPKEGTSMTKQFKTASGIRRPIGGQFVTFPTARSHARDLNTRFGRGHRALRTADGKGYGVIFRPAVANNKQRRVREVI